ncbi:GD23754 [Drosophila simulans]|uniref:GD23754 n=1 Tax=Drosophila simulans TaxID=7240 RepID=B4QA95_DROSI|nr:GD23754 [Drosophila simulans]
MPSKPTITLNAKHPLPTNCLAAPAPTTNYQQPSSNFKLPSSKLPSAVAALLPLADQSSERDSGILVLRPAIELEKLQELEELHELDEEEVAPLPLSLE